MAAKGSVAVIESLNQTSPLSAPGAPPKVQDSISLGPLLLPTQALLLVIATAAALGVLSLLRDGDTAGRSRAETRLFLALMIGVLGARLGWVAQHWQAYAESPWALLAFRDGGYQPWIGLALGGLAVGVMAYRAPAARRWRARVAVRAVTGGISSAVPSADQESAPRTARPEAHHDGVPTAPRPEADRDGASSSAQSATRPFEPASPHPPAAEAQAAPTRRQLLIPAAAGLLVLLTGQGLLELHARARATPLPTLDVQDMAGEPRKLPAGQGRPQVINLWASWCAPCRREMPAFARVQASRPDVDFVYLNIGESTAEISAFTRTLGAPLAPIWRDPESTVPERLQVRGYPTTFILDAEGRLLHRRSGELSEASLKALLPDAP